MTLTNDISAAALEGELLTDAMPLWLWDPAAARIVWANRASLDYSGAHALDDLLRLHFRPSDAFARQLATLAQEDLGDGGRRELIRFSGLKGERAYHFLCRNRPLGEGAAGLLLGLIGEAERGAEAVPAARNGAAEPAPHAVAEAVSELLAVDEAITDAEPAQVAESAATAAERPSDMAAETAPAMKGQPEPEPEPADLPPLIIDPAQHVNGFHAGAVDEDDLMTLQEIARMINGASFALAGPAVRPSVATRGEAKTGAVPSEALAARRKPAANDDFTEDAAASVGRGERRPQAKSPPAERNYFLEALPAAVALSMGGRLMRANEAFLYAFGFASESELRRSGGLAALFPESRKGVLVAEPADNRRQSRSARIVTLAVSRSGRRRQVPIAFRSVSTGREPVQVIVVLEDLVSALNPGAAPSAGAAGGVSGDSVDFLARVSHEIRTPLNSIIGFSELMKDPSLGQNDIRVLREYAGDIHTSAMHALSLVNDLLDITKIMAGKPDLALAPVSANEVARAALKLMKPQLEQKRILLTAALEEHMPMLLADRRSLMQILLNLVSNAIKFSSPGGRIAVSSHYEPRSGIVLSVSDSGVGMCKEEIALALEPFRQLEKALHATSADKGSGLGLPLTKALTEAHGAGFLIDSTPGFGTRVEIRFPPARLVP